MRAPTTWMERFRGALRIMCNDRMPPLDLCEKWINRDETGGETLQDWAMCNTSAWWSQGIVIIDAAMTWANTPEEGAGHGKQRSEKRSTCRRVMPLRCLDLFCCGGGAGMGYHLAGMEVVGVDIEPQSKYPFAFVHGDALEYLAAHGHEFDFIHASPPCQGYSVLKGLGGGDKPKLIGAVRELLQRSGKPWVIENVQGAARDMISPVMLCGSSFGLGVRRHRLFETSSPIALVPACAHHAQPEPIDVTGTGGFCKKQRTSPGGGRSRKPKNLQEARAAMGIEWLGRRELSQAIPPAYTRYLAEAMMGHNDQAKGPGGFSPGPA